MYDILNLTHELIQEVGHNLPKICKKKLLIYFPGISGVETPKNQQQFVFETRLPVRPSVTKLHV